MGAIDSNLYVNEEFVYRAKTHWFIYAPALISLVLFAAIGVVVGGRSGVQAFVALSGAYALPVFIFGLVKKLGTQLGITSKRVLARQGVFKRAKVDVFISATEELRVEQSMLGRIFNVGSVYVTGSVGPEVGFHYIKDPLAVQAAFNQLQGH